MGFANRLCGTGNRPLSHKENTRNRPLCSHYITGYKIEAVTNK